TRLQSTSQAEMLSGGVMWPLIHRQMLARELSIAKGACEMAARHIRRAQLDGLLAHAVLSPHADDPRLALRPFTRAMRQGRIGDNAASITGGRDGEPRPRGDSEALCRFCPP